VDASRRQPLLARIRPGQFSRTTLTTAGPCAASQAKALFAGGAVSREPDPAGIVGFHLLGSVPEPLTVWRRSAPPAGRTLVVDDAAAAPALLLDRPSLPAARLSRPATSPTPGPSSPKRCTIGPPSSVSDVPAAVFLSAGLDWGAARHDDRPGRRNVTAVTWLSRSFAAARDEAPLAAEWLPATARAMSCAPSVAPNSSAIAGDPRRHGPADHRRHQHLVRRPAAHEAGVKVALSGLGADECFMAIRPSSTPRSVRISSFDFIPSLGWLSRQASRR
jgi:asparagine synthase (glutamine-hydrolysing)